jgi:hypothetical protein
MGRHAFDQVEVNAVDGSVFVHGFSVDLDSAIGEISVAVIDPSDPERRLAGPATTKPSEWSAMLVQEELASLDPPREPFTGGETVLVVGAACMVDGELFAWGGVTTPEGYFALYELTSRVTPNPDN